MRVNRSAPLALLATLLTLGTVWADDPPLPKAPADLYQTAKVWTLHLRFTADQWKAIEPPQGKNPFMSMSFGVGSFLLPAVMRDGDTDKDEKITAAEFAALAAKWFADWDRDKADRLTLDQLRKGARRAMDGPDGGKGAAGGGGFMNFSLLAPPGKRNGLSGMSGIDFEYVHADLEFEGKTFKDVAVRYKGNGTFMESRPSIKRPMKIDLNKYVKGQKIAGVSTLNLHNCVTDAGWMNEVLTFAAFRDAGVPAPRTAYAKVYVTVPGKHDRKYLGLYELPENVDKTFISSRGLPAGGAIFKPSTTDLFIDRGDDWAKYDQMYDPKGDVTDAQKKRLIEFARFVTKAPDADFAARLGEFLEVEEFARFIAVTAWVADLDSILTIGQNYYLLLDPKTNKFSFVPWDKDHTFGSFGGRTAEDRYHLSVREPWEGRRWFLQRVFKVPAFRDRYLAVMAEFNNGPLKPEKFREKVAEIAAAIRPAVKEESPQKLTRFETVVAGKSLPGAFFGMGQMETLLQFVDARNKSVAEQLAGKREGRLLGKGANGQPDFRPDDMLGDALLKALDTDGDKKVSREEFVGGFKKWYSSWDEGKAGTLTEEQLRKGLNKSLPFPFPAPPPPPPKPADKKP